MFTLCSFFVVLLFPIIQCQNAAVFFPIFPVNTDIGSCTCDLTANQCDISCCCDNDCTAGDKVAFACSSRDNQYTNSTPIVSTVQPSCNKNLSIFTSDSPYIIQKMGELVCVDYIRYSGSQYYQQPANQALNPTNFVQALNAQDNVSPPIALPTNLTTYQVGTAVLAYNSAKALPTYFSLPASLLNNPLCSGTQYITYMNDFTSRCSQIVSSTTCAGALSPATYIGPFCLIRSPANPLDNSAHVCDTTAATATTSSATTCSGALTNLVITVSYSNPTGIVAVTVATATNPNAVMGASIQQTFTVQFVQSGSSVSSTTRNPGFLRGANLIARIVNGATIDTTVTPDFSILKPLSNGVCGATTDERIPIRFGENVQSTCKSTVSTGTCPDLHTLFMNVGLTNLYVGAYSNPNFVNASTDWLPVITCTSAVGTPSSRQCQNGLLLTLNSNGLCYIRLDIQIAYTYIGSVLNPQAVLSAVIFNYQSFTFPSTNPVTLLITETVTFQDISTSPIIAQGQIPTPSTSLPADFFYPFSVSSATKSVTFSSCSYFLISILFILM